MSLSHETVDLRHGLPRAIWIHQEPEPAIYRGCPLEMVRAMAEEMNPCLPPRDAIAALLGGLARNRRIHINLHGVEQLSEEGAAQMFVYALLDTGIARPLPQA
jgi:hypothetical protein